MKLIPYSIYKYPYSDERAKRSEEQLKILQEFCNEYTELERQNHTDYVLSFEDEDIALLRMAHPELCMMYRI